MNDSVVQVPPTGRISFDDVRAALDGIDPNLTNASKVRATLGRRGSMETIQKHLATLREELAKTRVTPESAGAVPVLPHDVAVQMWTAAWTAAQLATLNRTEKLATERDAAMSRCAAAAQDIAGLVVAVDAQATALERAAAAAAIADAEHLAQVEQAATCRAELDQQLVQSRAELAKAYADATHAAQVHDAGKAMLRAELERLTDQVGELKSHLYRRVDAVQA